MAKSSIYGVMRVLHFFSNIFGMAPYKLKKNEKKTEIKESNNLIQNIHIIFISAIIIFFKLNFTYDPRPTTTSEVLLEMMTYCKIWSAIMTVVTLKLHQKDLINAVKKVEIVDNCLLTINENAKLYYFVIYTMLFFLLLLTFAFPISLSVLGYLYNHHSIVLFFADLLSNGLQCLIHLMAATYFCVYVVLLYIKLSNTHGILAKFSDLDGSLKSEPILTLNNVCLIYANVCYGAGYINKVFSITSFFVTVFNMLDLMLIIYDIGLDKNRNPKAMVNGAYNVAGIFIVLFPTGFLQRKAKGLAKYLTESTMCYENKSASIIRSTFMLQMLQYDINLEACSCFSLSMSAFMDQMGFCISFLIFMFQLINIYR